MATIDRALADKLIKGNGKCKEGTAGYCLVRYQNRTKYDIPGVDLYNPDAEKNVFDYAVFSSRKKYEEFMQSETVGGVDILWGSTRFKKDQEARIRAEAEAEMTGGLQEFFPYSDTKKLLKSAGKERQR